MRCHQRTLPPDLDVQLLQSLHARPQRRDEIVTSVVGVPSRAPFSTLDLLLDLPEPRPSADFVLE